MRRSTRTQWLDIYQFHDHENILAKAIDGTWIQCLCCDIYIKVRRPYGATEWNNHVCSKTHGKNSGNIYIKEVLISDTERKLLNAPDDEKPILQTTSTYSFLDRTTGTSVEEEDDDKTNQEGTKSIHKNDHAATSNINDENKNTDDEMILTENKNDDNDVEPNHYRDQQEDNNLKDKQQLPTTSSETNKQEEPQRLLPPPPRPLTTKIVKISSSNKQEEKKKVVIKCPGVNMTNTPTSYMILFIKYGMLDHDPTRHELSLECIDSETNYINFVTASCTKRGRLNTKEKVMPCDSCYCYDTKNFKRRVAKMKIIEQVHKALASDQLTKEGLQQIRNFQATPYMFCNLAKRQLLDRCTQFLTNHGVEDASTKEKRERPQDTTSKDNKRKAIV